MLLTYRVSRLQAADDKERKQTVGTFPLMLIELGAIYRHSETYSLTHQCYSIQSALKFNKSNRIYVVNKLH